MNDDKRYYQQSYQQMIIVHFLYKLEYQAELIKEENPSELLRFTIRHILNQLHNNLIYPTLEEQEQKKAPIINNRFKVILSSTIITATACHQSQVPNISHRNNLVGQKMTPSKLLLSSLLSIQMNHHTF